jgi:hypothetical protein
MNILSAMLEFQNQVKIFHWQTYGYSEHESFGELYDSLSGHIDEFVEVFMGKYGRIVAKDSFVLTLQNYKSISPLESMNNFISFLSSDLPSQLDPAKDTDLLNIRDEILGSVNKTKYLITLK